MKEPELENYHVHCYLRELMDERGYGVDKLHRMSGVNRGTISNLSNNSFQGVSRQNIARLCGVLNKSIEELFVVLPKDIWLPIRLSKSVTVHFGSRFLSEVRPGDDGRGDLVLRPYFGVWDFRAFQKIQEYLASLAPGIHVEFKEHITGEGRGIDPNTRSLVREIFEGSGNHILIGSPVANSFVEEVVCRAYDVEPYNPNHRKRFPYGFAWDESRSRRSSLGWRAAQNVYGIAALPSEKVIVPCGLGNQAEGTDGALIVVYRTGKDPKQKDGGADQERIIICLLGYSGPGTDAAAQLATNSKHAAGLYPDERNRPRMRAVSCKYHRDASNAPYRVTDVELVSASKPRGKSKTKKKTSSKAKPARRSKARRSSKQILASSPRRARRLSQRTSGQHSHNQTR